MFFLVCECVTVGACMRIFVCMSVRVCSCVLWVGKLRRDEC